MNYAYLTASEKPSAMLRFSFCMAALFALSACKLDVMQTIDVSEKGREVITYRETFDDEAFRATAQLGGPSAFGFDAAKADGWDVRGSSGPNQHTFIFEHSFSVADAGAELTRLANDSTEATPDDAFLLGPTAFVGVPITAADTNGQIVSIPALLRPSETLTKDGRDDTAFQLANARVNAAVVDSVVHVHIELRDSAGLHRIEPSFSDATTFSPLRGAALHVGPVWPMSRVLGFWRNVGPYGVFDYEHHSPPLCSADPQYHKAWMFGVGVFAQAAHMPGSLMDASGTLAQQWLTMHPVRCP